MVEHKGRESEEMQELKSTGRRAAQETKEQAAQLAGETRRRVEEQASQKKGQLAEVVSGVGTAMHRAGEELRTRGTGEGVAGYLENMSQRVDEFSRYLENHDWQGMFNDAQKLAGKQPELFLGGMFVAGLAMGRFLKASEHDHQQGE